MLITQNTQDFIDAQSHAIVPAAPDTLLDHIINWLVIECQCIEALKPPGKSGPNLEYCNHAGGSDLVTPDVSDDDCNFKLNLSPPAYVSDLSC